MKQMNLTTITKWGLFVLSFLILYSCGSSSGADKLEDEEAAVTSKPVRVMKLEKRELSRNLGYSANLIPFDELYIAPASPGRILKIHVDVGDRVQQGQVLIEMDPTQLNQAILQLKSLEKDFERFDSLIQFGGIPKQQYDQMKTQLDITSENVDFLKINTTITAPFGGIISAKYFENGELFSGAPNTQVGKAAIVVLQRINPIKAVIAVSEKYYPDVKKGMSVNLQSEIYPDSKFEGRIFRIHPTINPASKTFNVEVEVPNSQELLRPGMFSRLEMEIGQDSAIVVPSNVVLQQLGTNERFVFLKVNGKAKRIQVKIGNRFDDELEIISDKLNIGCEIVVSGHNSLLDGDIIEVVSSER